VIFADRALKHRDLWAGSELELLNPPTTWGP
jgi:hypothetical protein